MISDSALPSGPDRLLSLLRNEYLRRLARFALIDGVSAPWSEKQTLADASGGRTEQSDG